MAKVLAYLGPPGTFTEAAAIRYDGSAQLMPLMSIFAVGAAVRSGMAQEGMVPIENSLEGSVNDTLDLLINERALCLRYELAMPIEHCLLVRPGTKAADIQAVYSHPQALGQCRSFIERCFPKAQVIAAMSTVAAVEEVKSSSGISAAIAPERAAHLHGMEILARGIQESPNNMTRFVVLSTQDHPPTGEDKTSLCFSFADDKAGLLYSVMGEFALRGINLTKVESRPTKESLGRYIFLVDLEGHREDPLVKEALNGVGKMVSNLRLFGSYPRWRTSLTNQ
ncbi:MAG: prephenate dehydratase [Chloroflexi bacterium]|nr:prephenate dehydratase [Chloroflexota bacterium]